MKILMLNAPTKEHPALIPPLGICYIASILRKKHEVKLIDLDLEKEKFDRIGEIIQKSNPDVLMVSALTPQIEYAYSIIKTAKKINEKIVAIVGGPHASALPERTLKECKEIDIVVIGEGEYISERICDIISKDKNFLKNIEKRLKAINKICFRKGKKIFTNEQKTEFVDVNKIPFPARDLLKFDKYDGWGVKKASPSTHIIASRGCPFNCVYCSEKVVFGRGNRRRDAKNVVDEIELLKKEYKIKEFAFYDDLFTANKEWVKEICEELIKKRINLPWKLLSRVDTIDLETLQLMKKAGCWMIFYGYESGSDKILKNINKMTTVEQGIKATILTKKVGIKIFAFFMLGNIGETKDTIKKTILYSKKISPDYFQFSIVRPDPGSPQYSMYKEEIEKKKTSWKEYYAFVKDEKSNLPVVGTELSLNELIKYRKIAEYSLNRKLFFVHLAKDILNSPRKTIKNLREVYLPCISKKYFEKAFS
jgi:radical SAM superfamily enzyme YgiQ (UPF0313 family)